MTNNEQEMLNAAFGTAMAESLVLTGITERLLQRGLLELGEVIFVTEEALRLMEQMRGGLPPEAAPAVDSGRNALTSRIETLLARQKSERSAGGPHG